MRIDAHTHCFPDALAPRALAKLETNFEWGERESGSAVPQTWSEAFAPIVPKVVHWLTTENITNDRTPIQY